MAIERMPITPEVLTWARKRAGYTTDALIHRFEDIRGWESGYARPGYLQLEELADLFELPIAVFFFPEPPERTTPTVKFFTLREDAFETLSPRMQFLVEKAQYRQRNFAELCAKSPPPKSLIVHDLRVSADAATENLAERIRDYLGVTVANQKKWSGQNKALDSWRRLLLNVGISVTLDDFREDDFSSFALYDPRFPIIYVCKSAYRRGDALLTICHSLIHLLFQTSGFDKRDDTFIGQLDSESRQLEELCNHLSTAIVIPTDVLENEFAVRRRTQDLAQLTTEIANLFGVGEEWTNNRLLALGLITDQQYRQTLDVWAQRGGVGGGWNEILEALLVFGESFIQLAFDCYDRESIDENELADFLEVAPRHLDDLRLSLESRIE